MAFDFDRIHPREGTGCAKWDGRQEVFGTEDVLPLWVADMDFAAPDAVISALKVRAQEGLFGYPLRAQKVHEAYAAWMERRCHWNIDPAWILEVTGVVPLLALAVQTLTEPGDHVVIQPPVYPPFRAVVERQGRHLMENPLRWDGTRYVMDLDHLGHILTRPGRTPLLILCSPHNPVGRVWERQELEALGNLCHRHGVTVLSDEIHGDLVYAPHRHTPFAALDGEITRHAIVATSAGKSFNIPGLRAGMALIPDAALRQRLSSALGALDMDAWNLFGIAGTEAAYRFGEPWLEALLAYLDGNRRFLQDELARIAPEVGYVLPEGTYLAWLDFRPLFPQGEALRSFLIEKARLGLNDGRTFGASGTGFARLNFACPRATLHEALHRLDQALQTR